ncbi:MAG: hypothetical protein HYU58_17100 [Proteobacteria bacterium]|nr:hypothetical protein [Pseudomonadota bacterium]
MAEYPISAAGTLPSPLYAGMADSGATGTGAIAGGKLRPGAIDQGQFQAMLAAQAQQQQQVTSGAPVHGMTLGDYRKLAGIHTAPAPALASAPAPAAAPTSGPANDGIPTLSLAQFAALTGMEIPDQVQNQPQNQSLATVPNSTEAGVPLSTGPVEAEPEPDPLATEEPAPQTADTATPMESTDGVPVSPGETPESAPEGPKDDRLVLLDTYPDREEQKSLAAQGKHWRMKDTPGARELFMGPDGEFGWDDFVDIINPLQHIPVVAQIYRAVTGDQAYGLSNFIGALPFGPISVASAIADTVVRAQTGRDAGTDMAAAVLGIDNRTPEEADLHLATGNTDQLAAASEPAGAAQVQVAALPTGPEAWTRDGIGRD